MAALALRASAGSASREGPITVKRSIPRAASSRSRVIQVPDRADDTEAVDEVRVEGGGLAGASSGVVPHVVGGVDSPELLAPGLVDGGAYLAVHHR
jgi:hypothetical protein